MRIFAMITFLLVAASGPVALVGGGALAILLPGCWLGLLGLCSMVYFPAGILLSLALGGYWMKSGILPCDDPFWPETF